MSFNIQIIKSVLYGKLHGTEGVCIFVNLSRSEELVKFKLQCIIVVWGPCAMEPLKLEVFESCQSFPLGCSCEQDSYYRLLESHSKKASDLGSYCTIQSTNLSTS